MLALLTALAGTALAQDAGEIEFWKSIQNSKNLAEFQAYLDTYPSGRFAPLARLRITQLGGKPAASPTQPPVANPQQAAPANPPRQAEPGRAEAPPPRENPAPAAEHAADLGAAIRGGDMIAVQAAVAQGADLNALDERGMPPIGLAALLGKPDIIAYLAANGADVNRNDRFGFTPLMDAAIRGQPEAARVLLALGADPTLKGGNGNDPRGAARPNGPADRRYEGKMAVTKLLEAAIAARSSSATPQREGQTGEPQQHAAASGAVPPPVGTDSLVFPADQPEVSTEAYLQDVAQAVREYTKLACDAPKFYHWKVADWDQPRFQRNTGGVLTALAERGYRLSDLKSPLDNLRIVRVDNAATAPSAPALLLGFYLEEQSDYYLVACSAGQ